MIFGNEVLFFAPMLNAVDNPGAMNPAPSTSAEAGQPAGGADRVLFVLATLAQHGAPITVRELVATTGLPKSTLYRQLMMLKRWGFVLESDGEYAPGPISLQLALGFDMASHLAREALPDMRLLAQQSDESVGLVVAVKDHVVCLEMVESRQSLRCSFEKGRGVPLRTGASAMSLLAFMRDEARERVVRAQCEPAEADRLLAELAAIRETGYAVSEGAVDPGVWGVSAPLFSRRGKTDALGSITLMVPATRRQGRETALIDMTVAAAMRISARLQSY
ncbi:HTH-type transcriptional regulator KipR [Cupriavidus numazuensis]|uniref:HTH-type transcriptional regulator KipR n=2 Tax=Cupriavidus numazuensis TaxID=221992 RepID=A0ABM8TR66_9BURK|nr:HTH-type transcriptional regulator KipR [Cupriavidus numazuensis]